MLFCYEKIKKERRIIISRVITEEDMYRFIRPICPIWLIFDMAEEVLAIP